MDQNLRKRKDLKERCPFCESSQIRKRKFLKNWICQKCKRTFNNPKSDIAKR